jgi:cytoskeleton protein RodZ
MIAAASSAAMQVTDLAGIGKVLRQARVAREMTVEDAALELHLQIRQINALEKGEFGSFSSPAFIKGYLRACAKLYGLEGDALITLYDSFLPPPGTYTPSILINSKKSVLASGYRSKVAVSVCVFIALIAVLSFVFWLGSRYWPEGFLYSANNALHSVFDVDDTPPDTLPDEPVELNVIENITPPDAPTTASLATAGLVDNPAPAANENQSVMTPGGDVQDSVLHIEFIDDCWVQLKDKDGHLLHEKVHKKGEVFDMSVKAPLHVWFGRAGAVNVSYNGAVVPVPVKQGFQSAQFILGDESSSGEIE